MIVSFKEYMTEVFSTSYPHQKMKGISTKSQHFYNFKDDKDQHFNVHVKHHADNPSHAEVIFSTPESKTKSTYMKTGKSGTSASKVISTVGDIMKGHAGEHGISHFKFSATDSEPSRQALYNRIAKRHGGTSEDSGKGHREYTVPTGIQPKAQKQIDEVFDRVFPHRKRVGLGGKTSEKVHYYTFNDKKNQRYRVGIQHSNDGMADVDFSVPDKKRGSSFRKTGRAGMASTGVLSTVGHIMKKHAANHGISHYTFSAVNTEPSRQSLYDKLTYKHGGNVGYTQHSKEYIIPTGVKREK